MNTKPRDSFAALAPLAQTGLEYLSLERFSATAGLPSRRLPYSLKLLLENLLRFEDGLTVTQEQILGLAHWDPEAAASLEIAFRPARVVLQDFTGVPAVVDFAAMRDAMAGAGGDPHKINPLFPSELVIDHSVQVDNFGTVDALLRNTHKEFERNGERYQLLRWGQQSLDNFKVVPPGTGIVHQVNLEHLARVVMGAEGLAYPDTVVGTDSHTTMINGLGVLGWGVGGIEAEAAMLGQPISLLVPQVLGVRLHGTLPPGSTATDLVLTLTEALRRRGVVGLFVEFFGPGLSALGLADRATIANMSPEFGSTCALFPIDAEVIRYLTVTGRGAQAALTETYARAQGIFHDDEQVADYSDVLEFNLSDVVPSVAGPSRPQDRVALADVPASWPTALKGLMTPGAAADATCHVEAGPAGGYDLTHGAVVIAAITSCTNTSNPTVMMAAGLLARKAVAAGLVRQPWVKTSLAPGSQVVTEYLKRADVLGSLEALGFNVVGYGCTTCIGNSGPLPDEVGAAIEKEALVACAVLSGNRNFEGRINRLVRANYLASPPLVVAYALAGRIDIDFETTPLGRTPTGKPVFLQDIWPEPQEVADAIAGALSGDLFEEKYADVLTGTEEWRALSVPQGQRFTWNEASTYVRLPPFFEDFGPTPAPLTDLAGLRVLALLGDSVTTDHISPAGSIAKGSPAAKYLQEHGVSPGDFNSYGARRGNHEVMMRGTFGNVRLRNLLAPGTEGGFTRHIPSGDPMTIFDAAMRYRDEGTGLVVLAGKEYGTGSSRDWAAKGTLMLGVRAVIAESFERIHRSNLLGMGVLPLQYQDGETAASLGLNGEESLAIRGISGSLRPGSLLDLSARRDGGEEVHFKALCRIDTETELAYYAHGGILPFVLRQMLQQG